LKGMFRVFLRNDQLIAIGIASLLFQVGNNLLIMIGMNFFYFEFGYTMGGSLVFWFTVMYGIGTLVSEALFSTMAARFTRKQILTAATTLAITGGVCSAQKCCPFECGWIFHLLCSGSL